MEDFEAVYRQHGRTVYGYLLSLSRDPDLAEELTQETMFRAILNIGAFRGECAVPVWLCQIAKHLYFAHRKKRGRHVPLEEAALQSGGDMAAGLEDRETAGEILALLETLEEPYRQVFALHVLGGVPLAEISRLFGKSESWARVTCHRARAKIAGRLKEGDP